jgi:hypothetical protein
MTKLPDNGAFGLVRAFVLIGGSVIGGADRLSLDDLFTLAGHRFKVQGVFGSSHDGGKFCGQRCSIIGDGFATDWQILSLT